LKIWRETQGGWFWFGEQKHGRKNANQKSGDEKWGIGLQKSIQCILIQKVPNQHPATYVSNPLMSHVVFAILFTENLIHLTRLAGCWHIGLSIDCNSQSLAQRD
jgi:hypothetical protein